MNNTIMVSVCMITYNQEKYIAQAIEGVIMQKTNFLIELVIGEDCSTDNTRQICKEYKLKYPEKIKLLLPKSNLGMMNNFYETLKECTGKYIALCEGDDYWTDPYKLQKQVDFLEQHEDVALCYTDCDIFYEDEKRWEKAIFKNGLASNPSNPLDGVGYRGNLTWVYRKSILDMIEMKPSADGALILLYEMCLHGKLGWIEDVTGVYRRHEGSASCNPEDSKKQYLWIIGVGQDILLYVDKFCTGKEALIRKISIYEDLSRRSAQNNDLKMSKYINDQLVKMSLDMVEYYHIKNSISYKLGYALLQPIRWINKQIRKSEIK